MRVQREGRDGKERGKVIEEKGKGKERGKELSGFAL